MSVGEALLMGVVQGITEPLPISSSGHLLLAHWLFGSPLQGTLVFDAALHLATGFAIAWFFREDILAIARKVARAPREALRGEAGWILLAALPAGLAGVLAADTIEAAVRSPVWVAIALSAGALVMLGADLVARVRAPQGPSFSRVFLLGLAQMLALIPGVSRSGITLAAARAQGFAPEEAARWAFLVGLPVIFGAGGWALVKFLAADASAGAQPVSWLALGVASAAAFVSALAALSFFVPALKRWGLAPFAFYRLALAAALLIVLSL